MRRVAQVAELVDALVSGTSGEIRGGSSPLLGTKLKDRYEGRRLRELSAFFVLNQLVVRSMPVPVRQVPTRTSVASPFGIRR